MKWGKRTAKKVDYLSNEQRKNLQRNIAERSKLRKEYDNGKLSYDNYVKQSIQLGRMQIQKNLVNAKKTALSNMSNKDQQKFQKQTEIGKKQADILLEKIVRGGEASLLDKLSLHGFK